MSLDLEVSCLRAPKGGPPPRSWLRPQEFQTCYIPRQTARKQRSTTVQAKSSDFAFVF
jgi:hypothetical protein